MLKRPFSSGAKLIAFAIVAVMLPTTILSAIQYRSLVDLEAMTKVAVEENLRQTLASVARKMEWNFKGLVKKSLLPIKLEEVYQENLEGLEQHFKETKEKFPEIQSLFVINRGTCPTTDIAVFCSKEGVRRIEPPQFKKNMAVEILMESYKNARLLRHSENEKHDLLFWQSKCSACNYKETPHFHHLIFITIFDAKKGEPTGFAGITLDSKYVENEFFARVMPEILQNPDIKIEGSDSALGILDETANQLYISKPWLKDYQVKMSFGPAFPRWKLGIGYKDQTIESLARDNFQRSLMLSIFVLSLLIIGIILTLRATAREMKLAQAKSTFVSNVSHELKTPLALIRLFAETLELGRVKSSERAHEYYRIINNESRRLTQLINNILDFSKIEANRKEYQFVPSDVAQVVEDVLTSYEYQITNAGFDLDKEIESGLPPALIDADALSQAVLNLLNNAVKYSEDVKKIAVRVRSRDHHIAIEVADRGIGIPRSEQKKIFEKFYRVSTGLVHDTKGSGLGLALVKHIVEAHHGQILVESAQGKGSRFTILIPISSADTVQKDIGFDAGGYSVAESANN